MTEYDEEFIKRFWAKVEKTDGCWLWTARCSTKGYGQIKYKNKNLHAHRVSLELALNRPIRDGFVVAHLPVICHNRACVNPAHLREATQSENTLDMRLDGTMFIGKDNKKPRQFTEDQIRAIRADDRVQRVIAEEYGCCKQNIWHIKNKKNYAWVSD
jgi:hypothetical protein